MRSGAEYLDRIADDGRTVILDGASVDDVTSHPAFHGVAQTIGGLYDWAREHAADMAVACESAGTTVNRVFAIPRTREDLERRRAAIKAWSRLSHGFVGRGPDHVGAFFAGFAAAPDVFDASRGAENVTRWHRRIATEDAFVSYAIIPPQFDRATTAGAWDDELLAVGVAHERDDGIVVRGSQMLGTGTAVADYLFVSCIKPLQPGDEPYANSFIVPVGAPGLKVYCRRPYATAATDAFDYPLSHRFDETDALIVFDDVFVPWEDVFVYRDLERARRQWFDTPAHALGNSQAQIRLVTKTRFLAGIAHKIAQANGVARIPAVQERLGELASLTSLVEGMVLASEAASSVDRHGVAVPDPRFLYGAMGLQAELYPRILAIVRDLAGGGLIQVPSSVADLRSEETRDDVARYFGSAGLAAEERIKLFKLAWDAVGSEFGGRHHQYEMFYAGAPFVARGYAYHNFGFNEAVADVDRFLDDYSAETPQPQVGSAS